VRKLKVRSKKGFTLIELMIVVAIIGVLAAIAIPAYRDYVRRARMSEVLAALDAIAQGATEYHAALGYFPNQSYGTTNLAYFSEEYANITLMNGSSNSYIDINAVAVFKSTLDLDTYNAASYGQLVMQITYDTVTGYGKRWDIAASTIDAVYMPKGGH
jgi:type IV pilus assembly protein PilA